MAVSIVRAAEKVWASESDGKLYLELKPYKNICKHVLKFSNYVLVRVRPINNYIYEQVIALFVILLSKEHLRKDVVQCNRCFANYFYFTHISIYVLMYQQ